MSIFKRYDFWIKIVAIVLLGLNILGDKFGFSVDNVLFMDITSALASVLVVLGVIQVPTISGSKNKEKTTENQTKNNKNSLIEGGKVMKAETKKIMQEELTELRKSLNGFVGVIGNEKLRSVYEIIERINEELMESEQDSLVEETKIGEAEEGEGKQAEEGAKRVEEGNQNAIETVEEDGNLNRVETVVIYTENGTQTEGESNKKDAETMLKDYQNDTEKVNEEALDSVETMVKEDENSDEEKDEKIIEDEQSVMVDEKINLIKERIKSLVKDNLDKIVDDIV